MANRYYMEKLLEEDRALVSPDETHHILRVMRKGIGDEIELIDGSNLLFRSVIESIKEEGIIVRVLTTETVDRELAREVCLIQGLCKGDKMDLIVQKTTELGIKSIIPIHTARSEVHLNSQKAQKKQERWQKIAREATKQCRRGVVPNIYPVADLKRIFENKMLEAGSVFVLYEDEKASDIRDALQNVEEGTIYFIVGPEGGFEPQEIEWLRAYGVHSIGLGQRTLRTETAGMMALSCVYYEFGDRL